MQISDEPKICFCLQAEEFVNDILRDRLASVLQIAVQKCPNCTLGIIVDGLEHYLVQRQRKDFQVCNIPPS